MRHVRGSRESFVVEGKNVIRVTIDEALVRTLGLSRASADRVAGTEGDLWLAKTYVLPMSI